MFSRRLRGPKAEGVQLLMNQMLNPIVGSHEDGCRDAHLPHPFSTAVVRR